MPTLAQGASVTLTASANDAVTVTVPVGGAATFESPLGTLVAAGFSGTRTFSQLGQTVRLTAVARAVQYEVARADVGAIAAQQLVAGRASSFNSAIVREMLTLGSQTLQPLPERVSPYQNTGTIRYCDPDVADGGAGTFISPKKYPQDAANLMIAGDSLLIAAGSTSAAEVFSTPLSIPFTGTANAPFVIGAYDRLTGRRISGVPGAARITARDSEISCIALVNRNYVCIDSLSGQDNNLADFGVFEISGTSANCQILNCIVFNSLGNGIRVVTTGTNNVVEGCRVTAAPLAGILVDLQASDSTTKLHYNVITGCVGAGIHVRDPSGTYSFSGSIAGNVVEDCIGTLGAIAVTTGGGAYKAFRNTVRRGLVGVAWNSTASPSKSFAGSLIENNDIRNCEFGIASQNTRGRLVIQYNRIADSGSYTGETFITTERYGRGIELFGSTEAGGTYDVVVRFNYVTGSFCWGGNAGGPGTEGVGIGFDNWTVNCEAYGNYLTRNEGQGIQINSAVGNLIHGNICVDNCVAPASRGFIWPEEAQCEILHVLTPYVQIFNNTIVQVGGPNQKYSIAESRDYSSTGARVFNNLCIGAATAGIIRTTTAGGSTESNNVIVGAPKAVIDAALAVVTAGAGTVFGTSAAYDGTSAFYKATEGGVCDGTGGTVPGSSVAFSGIALGSRTPVGALHGAF